MAAKKLLAIFALAAVIALSFQYPALDKKDLNTLEKMFFGDFLRSLIMRDQVRSSCVPLGQSGCDGNNGKCCRRGDPYTGQMRNCVNEGSFASPDYRCRE